MSGSRGKAALLLVAAFAAGGATGAIAMDRYKGEAHDQRGAEAYMDRLTRELTLDAAQQSSVQAVLDRYTPQMEALFAETRPRFETMRTALRSDISALLTDAQRTRYEEMIRRHDAERNARTTRRP